MLSLHFVFFVMLLALYSLQEIALTRHFRHVYAKPDNFIGKLAPDATQAFFGKALYLVLSAYVMSIIQAGTGFHFWGLVSIVGPLTCPMITIVGLALGIAFLTLMIIARVQLGKSWRVGLDYGTEDVLVTQGIYRRVRNPYFTGYLGLQLSLFLVTPNTASLFAFVLNIVLLNFQVRQEEVFLTEKYGQAYLVYLARTGRFLPRFRRK